MNIAIVIPVYNEEVTIAEVIRQFHGVVPRAEIHIIDNSSTDRTAEVARKSFSETGCVGGIHFVPRRGKANAVRWAFRQLDADVYVLVDGDTTYAAEDLQKLMAPIVEGRADMTVGDRFASGDYAEKSGRLFHHAGSMLVRSLINRLFRTNLRDIMSGYRVFNRLFVKNYSILCEGFELETEMTLHALDKRFNIQEVPIRYHRRPAGSQSKLYTFGDGTRVMGTILRIFKDYRPLAFFGSLAIVFFTAGLLCGALPVLDFVLYRYVYHVPLAILAVGLMLFASMNLGIGLVLDTMANYQRLLFERQILHHDNGRP